MADKECWQAERFNMTRAWEEDFGIFPIHARDDTGRHISENGMELALILGELHRQMSKLLDWKTVHWHQGPPSRLYAERGVGKTKVLGGMKANKLLVPPCQGRDTIRWRESSPKRAATPSSFRTDGMVSTASAANIGKGDELCFLENNRYREIPGVVHFSLPSHPEVYRTLAEWCAEGDIKARRNIHEGP